MREQGVAARGIDLSEESVAQCRRNGLHAEVADLFSYLVATRSGVRRHIQLPGGGASGSGKAAGDDPPVRGEPAARGPARHRNAESGMPRDLCDSLLSRSHAHASDSASPDGVLHGGSGLRPDRSSRTLSGGGIDAGDRCNCRNSSANVSSAASITQSSGASCRMVLTRPRHVTRAQRTRAACAHPAGRSSNGRTADSGSAYRGSNPCLPAKSIQQLEILLSRFDL